MGLYQFPFSSCFKMFSLQYSIKPPNDFLKLVFG
nr:MAG TPA: hypothetical protein [Caudoviricetes sp.]